MALQAAVAERWEALTGHPIIEGYGLTETSPVLTFNPFGRGKIGSIGVPIPSTEIKCVDEGFVEVAPGAPGELACRGPQVMAGYWRRPEETAQVMRGEWFLTGDIATMDADGFFRIVDRRKDMILVSGFNVFPNEVEEVLVEDAGDQGMRRGRRAGRGCWGGAEGVRRAQRPGGYARTASGPTARSTSPATRCRASSSFATTCRSRTSARS